MMHYDQGGNNQLSQAFYQNLVSRGVPFDVIGLSYYPFFHGTISQMRANVDALATQFHKPIVIAETQYAWTLANGNSVAGDSTGDFVWEPSLLSAGYPATPGGQLSFVTDELSILAQVPDGLGAGLFYWAPDWIRAWAGSRAPVWAHRTSTSPCSTSRAGHCRRSASSRTRPPCARATTPTTSPAPSAPDYRPPRGACTSRSVCGSGCGSSHSRTRSVALASPGAE